jgi:hypothetical protein
MAQISETFLPRFLGAFPCARSPLGALAKTGESEMFVEHSSTKTNLSETMLLTYVLKALLLRSSRSEDAIDLF